MDMVLFGAGCMILGGAIGASVGLLMYVLWLVRTTMWWNRRKWEKWRKEHDQQ